MLFFVFCLGVAIFLYAVVKPVPPGVDAAVYINDVHWIVDNNTLPKPYQLTYHGSGAYTAPLTDLNLALLNIVTNLDIVFPLFSIYQIFLILLLLLSCYLVGRIYGKFSSILLPIALLGSFSIIRLFIGSTVSNLLAFVYINITYYFTYKYFATRKKIYPILIAVFLLALYLTHNYLTAPIYILTYIVYVALLIGINKTLRSEIKKIFFALNRYFRLLAICLLFLPLLFFFKLYLPVFKEAKHAFWLSISSNKFMKVIPFSEFHTYLGDFVFVTACLGILVYVTRFKENIRSYKLLPVIFFIVIAGLSQTYKLGVNFYFERIIFLAGTVVAVFSAFYIFQLSRMGFNRKIMVVISSIFIVLIVTAGANRVYNLYNQSNKVTAQQIEALRLLNQVSGKDDLVYSNFNAVSETYHDSMLTDRDIRYFSTSRTLCNAADVGCIALNTPSADSSLRYFKEKNVKYFLFMKNSFEGNGKLDALIALYQNNHYISLFSGRDVSLFKIM